MFHSSLLFLCKGLLQRNQNPREHGHNLNFRELAQATEDRVQI